MIIFAIDPGPNDSAFVQWDTEKEIVRNAKHVLNHELLAALRTMEIHYYGVIAIEDPQAQRRPASDDFIKACKWTGIFQEAISGRLGIGETDKLKLIPYRDVSAHFCKIVNAKEKFVKEALIKRFGDPGTKKNPGKLYGITGHCMSALAVAVTCQDKTEGLNGYPDL